MGIDMLIWSVGRWIFPIGGWCEYHGELEIVSTQNHVTFFYVAPVEERMFQNQRGVGICRRWQ